MPSRVPSEWFEAFSRSQSGWLGCCQSRQHMKIQLVQFFCRCSCVGTCTKGLTRLKVGQVVVVVRDSVLLATLLFGNPMEFEVSSSILFRDSHQRASENLSGSWYGSKPRHEFTCAERHHVGGNASSGHTSAMHTLARHQSRCVLQVDGHL